MEKKELFELTNPQKSIWLMEQYYSNTNVAHISGCIHFHEHMNVDILIDALNLLIQNNESFRTSFILKDDKLYQYVREHIYTHFNTINLNLSKQEIDEIEKTFMAQPFDLFKDSLIKVLIVTTTSNEIKLFLKFHHIVTDAWSLSIVASQISEIYSNLMNNTQNIDADIYQYSSYIHSEIEYLQSEKYIKDKNYWESVYNSEPPLLSFHKNTTEHFADAKRIETALSKSLTEKINNYCSNNKISAYCFFLTVLQVYFSNYFNSDDIVIGNPFLNRKNYKQKKSIGMYISTLPLRLKLDKSQSISNLLYNNTQIIRNTLKHEQYPHNDILKHLKKQFNITESPYSILFSFQNAHNNSAESSVNYHTEWRFSNYINKNLEIHIHDRDNNGYYNIFYDFQTNIFNSSEINKLNLSILNIIDQILENNDISIMDIELITPSEKKNLLEQANLNFVDFSDVLNLENIYNVIFSKNKNYLDTIALEDYDNNFITYRLLFSKINKLITLLKSHYNITPNQNIGIITDKNIDTIIGILAILKLGCTIVPIDPKYPKERQEYIVNNSNLSILLFTNSKVEDLIISNKIDICYAHYDSLVEDSSVYNYNRNNNAYIIYTSGSTGEPKAVTISHKNIINLIEHQAYSKEFTFNNSKILQFATLSFDVAYQEIFTALFNNVTLTLIEDTVKKDSNLLVDYIIDKKIDILFIPPKYLLHLADSPKIDELISTLKHVVTAGEQLIITDNIAYMINNSILIHNHYGPAETHVVTTNIIDANNIYTKPAIRKTYLQYFCLHS